ncbi:MAG: Glu/Leu/Phe/Val dehydrogenase [Tissierellia bacterium]|nr:Glu/Leu/Phe/Val dehydrogenase [Tissierellia bacterium]
MSDNVLFSAQEQIRKACEKLELPQAVFEILKEPQRVLEVSIPVRMDDGSTRVFKGYRSQHNDAIGPYKGGIRFHPNVNLDEVKALSIWMTFKCGIVGIPYGGGKGGITVDVTELSQSELERLSRGFIEKTHKYLGDRIDIPAPDVNTNAQVMSWMVDEFNKLSGHQEIGVITGKPVALGGSLGRTEATGFGVVEIAKAYLKKEGLDPKETTAALQGFGNVGSYTGKYLYEAGIKTVAVAGHDKDKEFAIYNEDGIDIPKLMKFLENEKDIRKFDNVKTIDIDEFWALDVDLLIPAALENAIDKNNAKLINAKAVLEAANGPITLEADEILKDRNIVVTPDVLTNAGGVTVSYFEWVQNRYGYYWSEKEVLEKESIAMNEAFNNIWDLMKEYDVTMREAAYMFSIKKVAENMKLKGWY